MSEFSHWTSKRVKARVVCVRIASAPESQYTHRASNLCEVEIPASDPRWKRTDSLLFEGVRIQAVQAFREDFGLSLRKAIEHVGARFSYLVDHQQDRFQVPLADYWDGFYS